MARKPWIVPIPGTTKMDHLRENIGSVNVQLTATDLRDIETGFSRIGDLWWPHGCEADGADWPRRRLKIMSSLSASINDQRAFAMDIGHRRTRSSWMLED